MTGQAAIHGRDLLAITEAEQPADLLAEPSQPPGAVGSELTSQFPGVKGIEGVGRLDLLRRRCLADPLEVLPAKLLDQRLEKGHPQHLALALVDAPRQLL